MTIGTYIRIILKKKGLSQQDLVDLMNKKGLCTGKQVHKQHISNYLNSIAKITPTMARKMEIALDLPKYSLVEMVGFPTTEHGKKELEGIG